MDAEPIKKLSLIFVWPKTNSRSYTFGDFLFMKQTLEKLRHKQKGF